VQRVHAVPYGQSFGGGIISNSQIMASYITRLEFMQLLFVRDTER